MNINILSWYLLKGKPKKLWTFPKLKLWFQNNNFGPKKHQNYLKKSMDIHVWPTYLLKICPNFFLEKNMVSTDPTYLWFDMCQKFHSFLRPSLINIIETGFDWYNQYSGISRFPLFTYLRIREFLATPYKARIPWIKQPLPLKYCYPKRKT